MAHGSTKKKARQLLQGLPVGHRVAKVSLAKGTLLPQLHVPSPSGPTVIPDVPNFRGGSRTAPLAPNKVLRSSPRELPSNAHDEEMRRARRPSTDRAVD